MSLGIQRIVSPSRRFPRLLHRSSKDRLQQSLLRLARFTFTLTLAFSILTLVRAISPMPVIHAAQQEAKEYELKAVYLYNFLQFLQRPDSEKGPVSRDDTMVIGVVGESPFGEALDDLVKNVRQNGMKPVRLVTIVPSPDSMPDKHQLTNCDLLFFGSSEKARFDSIIKSLNHAPVLTVADSDGFLAAGGMINLVHSGGKIRWMINRAAIERTGLRMSVQVLSMAIRVYDGN